jgi:hypothetical protein
LGTFKYYIQKHTPSIKEFFAILSLCLLMISSYTLYRLFWHVPSWLYYLNLYDVLTITAYSLSFVLIESLACCFFLIFVSFVLPVHIFKNKFIVQGYTIIIYIGVIAFAIQRKMRIIYSLNLQELLLIPLLFFLSLIIVIIISSFIYDRLEVLEKIVYNIADRVTVFLYIYLPICVFCSFVVIFRNIF